MGGGETPLKPQQITVKTKASETNGTGGPTEPRGPARSPKSFEKKTTPYQYPPKGKGMDPPDQSTNDNKKPSDRFTHAGTIKITRSD